MPITQRPNLSLTQFSHPPSVGDGAGLGVGSVGFPVGVGTGSDGLVGLGNGVGVGDGVSIGVTGGMGGIGDAGTPGVGVGVGNIFIDLVSEYPEAISPEIKNMLNAAVSKDFLNILTSLAAKPLFHAK